ncbi:prephenate dehydrogenase [Paraferrimonas sedimenticola]|uniref:Prephenate dehydrogenase n=1 Tax=Paraferrimonas sedimenticola TaxID=375674 RepID=A0AA37RXZ3_9GAMM|nr:prephenate dehydrogenase [Paraferrimonas sedimenticola]GLP97290.1 hypothetical protein GCM10007895_25970 [Paraferrimonas sedimenticola]
MATDTVLAQIRASLQTAYRQVHDADKTLEQLGQKGHANFGKIFKADQGFTAESNRFMPYLEEVVSDYDKLAASEQLDPEQLKPLVSKLGLLLNTLAQFKQQLSGAQKSQS